MKRSILKLLCLILTLSFFSACSSNEVVDERTVVLDEIGLTYTVPESWSQLEQTNIVPLSYTGEYTFAEVIYLYVTQEDIDKVNAGEGSFKTLGQPIFEIAVAEKDDFIEENYKAIFAYFNSYELVSQQGDYVYYVFYDSKYAEKNLDEEHLENYNFLVQDVPQLIASIKTKEFDPTPIQSQIDFFNEYITFDTETLDGAPVMSTIFADYDLCMVNFGVASYYPEYNEFETLSSVNFMMKNIKYKRVGLIQILTDSYYEKQLKAAIAAKKAADADLITLKLDSYSKSWVEKNLKSVPSSVFVDTNGKIIGDIIEGTLTYEEYLDEMDKRLEILDSQE